MKNWIFQIRNYKEKDQEKYQEKKT